MKKQELELLIGILVLVATIAGVFLFIFTASMSNEIKLGVSNTVLLLFVYVLVFYLILTKK